MLSLFNVSTTLRSLALVLQMLVLAPGALFAQVDNRAKNGKVLDALEAQYQQALKADPNGAAPHWHHANALAKVTFRASQTAWQYYELALRKDSLNANIYQDYAAYLAANQAYKQALAQYDKGLALAPTQPDLLAGQARVQQLIRQQEEYAALHRLPVRAGAAAKVSNFAELTDFAKLLPLTQQAEGAYAYPALAAKFRQDPAAPTPHEMLLLLGATARPDYKPYNYDAEQALQQLAADGKTEELIRQGEALLAQEPVNVLALQELLYGYRKQGNNLQVARVEQRLRSIFEGVLYGGDGSCEQPYLSISPQEEYVFVQYLGLQPTRNVSQTSCAGFFTDKLLVVDKSAETSGQQKPVYFNYTPIMLSMRGRK
ncbi:DUF4919 domain-containing protein [Hymenobacter monticola]|uniref:DUF4919 domain-containing protein n=1 Tax=Hymenobacter monticola TaxID=1705399 RepID=A0ABY4B2W1_9BACT|nr:DUF4919 domain-containing protein [Hymenobacter monticola]UOE32381.1 DUF4919 domain-containing protein [Hymenobacter monticola]